MQLIKLNNGIKYYILPCNLYVCKYKDNEYVVHCTEIKTMQYELINHKIDTS